MRTLVLMNLANKNGGMVVGTGDLSELALGWATYNGDHMSMYGVNGSIPKTLVRYLVAVSYTHLDVYKRQILGCTVLHSRTPGSGLHADHRVHSRNCNAGSVRRDVHEEGYAVALSLIHI